MIISSSIAFWVLQFLIYLLYNNLINNTKFVFTMLLYIYVPLIISLN
jgi:uncharacterized membrane protein